MADIALRDYDYEIAAMLDAGEFNEAIAHCLHILRAYPKHLQAYRLLAQAFVKSQHGGEAILVYQRLLSAVPDEFDAHNMMSTIHEQNGNLEAALWHAKRAFEIQPAEKSIQERLRDLFTLRDGKAPPMRLTRGALARMYADQAHQTEQAVNEIRSILSEKPERVDLQILLAQVYHNAGQDDEAIQVCASVLEALPNALEANCILAEIYDETNQVEQAEVHWTRVKEIEPYDKRLESRMLMKDATFTDDNTISSLEGIPAEVLPPGWENSMGILPSILVAVSATPPSSDRISDETETQTATDDAAAGDADLQTWLNETSPGPTDTIGTWLEGKGSPPGGDEVQAPTDSGEASQVTESSRPLPEWLYNLAKPKSEIGEQPTIEEPVEEAADDWMARLEKIRQENLPFKPKLVPKTRKEDRPVESEGQGEPEKIEPVESPQAETPFVEEQPEWLPPVHDQTGDIPSAVVQPEGDQEPASELPGGLPILEISAEEISFEVEQPLGEQEGAGELPGGLPTPEIFAEEISFEVEQPLDEQEGVGELPAWLPGGEVQTEEVSFEVEQTQGERVPANVLPEWLEGLGEDGTPLEHSLLETTSEVEQPEAIEVSFEIPSFEEESLTAEPLAEEGITPADYRPDDYIPDWLKMLEDIPERGAEAYLLENEEENHEGEETQPQIPEQILPQAEDYHPIEHLPEWLNALETMEPLSTIEESVPPVETMIPQAEEQAGAELELVGSEYIPTWLTALIDVEETPAVAAGQVEAGETGEATPEWLVDLDRKAEITGQEAPPQDKRKSHGPGPEWDVDIEKLLETVEQIAPGEEEVATIQLLTQQKAQAKPAEEIGQIETQEEPSKSIPSWLLDEEEVSPAVAGDETTLEEGEVEEALPDWMAEVDRASQSFAAMVETALTDEGVEQPIQEAAGDEEEVLPFQEIPDWMREIMEESLPSAPSEEQPEFQNFTEAIDWLENATEQALAEGETAPPGVEEPVPSFEMPQEADLGEGPGQAEDFKDSQIELTSEERQPKAVSSMWVLESLSTPQSPGISSLMGEITRETARAHPTLRGVNINKAGLADLEQLPHVGFRLAQNIINYRQSHGEFHSLDDLRSVPKMNADILNEIASHIQFEDMPVYSEQPVYRGEELAKAKTALSKGDLAVSMAAYHKQIAQRVNLPEVIKDLRVAVQHFPEDLVIWQTLGDAYLQAGDLDEALDSYRKAEEILQ